MSLVFEVERTGQVAWSVDTQPTLLASGTVANTVGEDFLSSALLEIFSLAGNEMRPIANVSTALRFHKLAWSSATAFPDHSRGIIAGGMADGSVCLWSPTKMSVY